MRQLALLVLLAACAPSDPSSPTPGEQDAGGIPGAPTTVDQLYKSGTRIQARTLKTADGAEFFEGWYDAERGEPCSFASSRDGKRRCMPAGAPAQAFADASCTRPVGVTFDCQPPEYVSLVELQSCGGPAKITLFESMGGYDGEVWAKSSSGCVASVRAPTLRYWLAGNEVPASSFEPTL
jgi:hypothetical protein